MSKVVKDADAHGIEGAAPFSVADFEEEAALIVRDARAKAAGLIARAKDKAGAVLKEAHAQGSEDGRKAGYEAGHAEGREAGQREALEETRAKLADLPGTLARLVSEIESVARAGDQERMMSHYYPKLSGLMEGIS